MSPDAELLRRSALAAGYLVTFKTGVCKGGVYEGCFRVFDDGELAAWNPLRDDGDALRLAVALRLQIEPMRNTGGHDVGYNVWPTGRGDCAAVECGNAAADMRRAVVRAAAALA